MPRRARILLPDVSVHLIQRGNNRSACFYADEDYLLGGPKFSAEVEAALGRRVTRGKPGRPKSAPDI